MELADIDEDAKARFDILRATEAKKLLENELLSRAFADVDSDLINRWKKTGTSDVETRESIWREANLLKSLKSKIESHIHTGEVAKANLLERMKQRLTRLS